MKNIDEFTNLLNEISGIKEISFNNITVDVKKITELSSRLIKNISNKEEDFKNGL